MTVGTPETSHTLSIVQAASFLLDKQTHDDACAALARKGRQTVRKALTGGDLQKLFDMPSPIATQLPANLSLDEFSMDLAQLDESDLCAVLRKLTLYEIVYLRNAARMRSAALAARFSEGTLDLEVCASSFLCAANCYCYIARVLPTVHFTSRHSRGLYGVLNYRTVGSGGGDGVAMHFQ